MSGKRLLKSLALGLAAVVISLIFAGTEVFTENLFFSISVIVLCMVLTFISSGYDYKNKKVKWAINSIIYGIWFIAIIEVIPGQWNFQNLPSALDLIVLSILGLIMGFIITYSHKKMGMKYRQSKQLDS